MKFTKTNYVVVTLALLALFAGSIVAAPSGTAFTYQGRLTVGANVANGNYDLNFSLYDALSSGSQVGSSLTNTAAVSNGLFTVTLDFGASAFNGDGRWLEIGARTNGSGAFTTLSPRQKLTPTPYAITAGNFTGTLPSGQLAGTYGSAVTFNNAGNYFTGSGAGLTSVNAATLGGLGAAGFWQLAGNAGTTPGVTFLGTTDNQPLEIRVNNQRAFHIEYTTNTPNIIGGWSNNFAAPGVVMATIGGGGGVSVANGSLNTNSVWSSYGTVSGGLGNQAGSINDNPSSVRGATVSGGANNTAGAHYSTISGGTQNTIILSSDVSTIGGGAQNTIQTNAYQSMISGGLGNTIQTNAYHSTISGGALNTIQTGANDAAIGGGFTNTIGATYSTISGGMFNSIQTNANAATISGGALNTIQTGANDAAIGGGGLNTIQVGAHNSTIGGGSNNTIQATAPYSTISGGLANTIQTNASAASIGGGYNNTIQTNAYQSTISGGWGNTIETNANNSTIGGGAWNLIQRSAFYSTVGGGLSNTVQTTATYSTISGGRYNTIQTNAYLSVIGGGYNNNILTNAHYATIPGGINNVAAGSYSFAFGNGAKALHDGAFVWGDSIPAYISSTVSNSWTARASGGVRFFSDSAATVGVQLAAGGNAWSPMSDRNVKENFQPVDQRAVLEKVCRLPVTEWNLISQAAGIRHIGPMAQDFQAAFGVGEDDRHISTSDADGVAFAAIQGLNQKVEQVVKEKNARIQTLEKDVAELKAIVNSLLQKSSGGAQ